MNPKQSLEELRSKYFKELQQFSQPTIFEHSIYQHQLLHQKIVYHQKHENLCGFHALSNLISFDLSDFETLYDEDKFIENYHKCRQFFAFHLADQTEKEKIIKFQPFERSHLDLLFQKQSQFPEIKNRQIASLIFGFNYIQNQSHQLQRLVDKINQVKHKKIEQLFIFLGITTHWTLLVLKNNPLQVIHLDSMNYPLGDIMRSNYKQLKQNSSEYRLQKAYFNDLKRSIQIVLDLLLTDKNINVIKFEGQLKEMLDSFDEYSNNQKTIKKWIQDQYAVPVIRNDVLDVLKGIEVRSIGKQLRKRFFEWVKVMNNLKIMELMELEKVLNELIKQQ